jgi:uncharacterized FlaG/YvyC family protein
MDVSATGAASAAAAAQVSVGTVTGSVGPAPEPASTQVAAPAPSSNDSAPASEQGAAGGAPASSTRDGIAPAIAKLFGSSATPDPIRLDVSYRVLRDPNQIVTVFSDPKTGQEVAQFPPELLINLAQFFDQQRGVTLDADA